MHKIFTAVAVLAMAAGQSACTQTTAERVASPPASPQIVVSEKGVSINGTWLARPASLAQVQAALGRPSRVKANTPQELAEKQRKFGTVPSDIYTYDALGILVYQKPGRPYVESIDVELEHRDFDFSPAKPFPGVLRIGARSITPSTTLTEVRDIAGMQVMGSSIHQHSATYGAQTLHFGYGLRAGENLKEVGIELAPAPKTNAQGWAANEISIMRAGVLQTPQIQQLAAQYNFNAEAFADCYVQKVSTQFTKAQVQAPTSETQQRLQAAMEACVVAVAKR